MVPHLAPPLTVAGNAGRALSGELSSPDSDGTDPIRHRHAPFGERHGAHDAPRSRETSSRGEPAAYRDAPDRAGRAVRPAPGARGHVLPIARLGREAGDVAGGGRPGGSEYPAAVAQTRREV